MPTLTIKGGAQAGRRFEFVKDVEIGRESGLSVSIPDRTISRRHATLAVRSDGVIVTDLKSQNGTAVNGQVVSVPTRLKDGDELRLGSVLLEFREDGAQPAAPAPASSAVRLDERRAEVLHHLDATNPGLSFVQEGAGPNTAGDLQKRFQLLYDVSLAIHQTLDEKELLGLILGKLFEVFPSADRGFILLHEKGREELETGAALARAGVPPEVAVSRTLVWDVINKRRGVVSADALTDGRFDEAKSIIALGIRSVVCVPMIADGAVLGVIALDSLRSSGAFGKADMALLVGIAAQAAMALARARLHHQVLGRELLDRDLALARRIQMRFLPRSEPERDGWEFRAYYHPALEVGGDYYDFLELPDGRLGVAVGDVSGKGISASLYMVKVSTEVRYASAGQVHPGEVLRSVNLALCRDLEEGMFVTCTLLVLEPKTGRVRVASAGHMPPLVRRADGSIVEMGLPRASPLGVNEAAVYSDREFTLLPGDTAVLYTDGISEATKKGGELFGEARLVNAISAAEGSPSGVLGLVLDRVKAFEGEEPQYDDITLVCFGPRPTGKKRAGTTAPIAPVGRR